MAKFKIQKGLSDADMMKGFVETETFETAILKDNASTGNKLGVKVKSHKTEDDFYQEFLTERIKTEIGKLLLAIKMDYFKEDVKDFSIQVKRNGQHIVLETAPKKVK
ncbi:hypothetical protein [Veillonella sp. CNR 79/14]|uniref:hypothetical protein n=1 Tax=Veillonella sp. CNR 79/14 TaxID=2490954 RepID=UPI000F8F66D9|nr:hypothetical protein [Veillonella sp. CNR 79/14]